MKDQQGSDDATLEEAWLQGEPVELKRTRPPTSVLSIRVPSELLKELTERARRQGKPASHLARELIEAGLVADSPSTPEDLARTFSRWVEELAQPLEWAVRYAPSLGPASGTSSSIGLSSGSHSELQDVRVEKQLSVTQESSTSSNERAA